MQAQHSLSHSHSVSASASAFDLTNFCENCQAYVELNTRGRCDVCGSAAISSPLASKTEMNLRRLVAVVRQSREAA
jgi:rRNA maturation endonuclease Nob1